MKWPQLWVAAFVVTLPAGKGTGKAIVNVREITQLQFILLSQQKLSVMPLQLVYQSGSSLSQRR